MFDNLLEQHTELRETDLLVPIYCKGYNSGTATWKTCSILLGGHLGSQTPDWSLAQELAWTPACPTLWQKAQGAAPKS